MNLLVSPSWMKKRDTYTSETIGIPSMVLMERAAKASADIIMQAPIPNKEQIYILCGRGNNGGDGFAIGRILFQAGLNVCCYCPFTPSTMSEETCNQYNIVRALGIHVETTLIKREQALIIDALFGSGLNRPVKDVLFDVIEEVNTWSGYKVAIDIPSGICGETGQVLGVAFQANLTISLGYKKMGTVLYPGRSYSGINKITDIGLYQDKEDIKSVAGFTYSTADIDEILPHRSPVGNKGTFGKVLIVGGSPSMGGAAYLSAKAAYMMGAGIVQVYSHKSNLLQLQTLLPEAIVTTYEKYEEESLTEALHWATAISIGSGLSRSLDAEKIFTHTISTLEKTCIIDGDALYFSGKHEELLREKANHLILTPHIKEMTYLCQNLTVKQIKAEPLAILKVFTDQHPLVCALKDACTLVSQTGKPVYFNESGCQAMAKGGSGDVLAGMIVGLIAQGLSQFEATTLATYIHGLAGEGAALQKGDYGVLASDIIRNINSIIYKENTSNE